VVVQSHVAHQGLLQILPTVKVMRLEHICNAAVEAFDHAVGSWRSGFGQAVFNVQGLAQLIKLVQTRGLPGTGGKEPIRELFAVVRLQLTDLERTGLVQGAKEGLGTGRGLVVLYRHEHPARGAVDGHEQVAPLRLISHLRQVLHVHVQVARLVALEALMGLTGRGGFEGIQVAHAMAAQTAVKARAAGFGADELARDGKQVVQRQQQGASQLHDHMLLGGREGGLKMVCGVRAVLNAGALFPLVDSGLGDAKALSQAGGTGAAGGDFCADGGCGARVLVQGYHHVDSPRACVRSYTSALIAARAMNSG